MTRRSHTFILSSIISILLMTLCCAPAFSSANTAKSDSTGEDSSWTLDPLSYALGNFSTFAEIVDIGLKKMALSKALPPPEMDPLEREARAIASEWDVEIYRESDFLVTDLFPPSATDGKDVLIIYKGDTLEEYQALKARKQGLVATGAYDAQARRELAWAMGKLLSYPDAKIEQLLAD